MTKYLRTSFLLATILSFAPTLLAHCDSLAGPVVADARTALKSGDAVSVLKWVRESDEPEVRAALSRALAVRELGPEARDLGEQFFFETVVRLHRGAEGAPYSGLKPATVAETPVLRAIDTSLQTGNADDLIEATLRHVRSELAGRFKRAALTRKTADQSVAAGREYVSSYVDLVHFVEKLQGTHAAEQTAEVPKPHEH